MALIDKASLLMVPSTYEAGKLYNVLPSGNRAPDSTDQNSGYDQTRADFSFDRGSNAAATRIGSDGLIKKYRENKLLQSNKFDTTWTKSSATIASGQSGYDGTSDAWLFTTSVAGASLEQSITAAGVVVFSLYAKANSVNGVRLRIDAATDANGYFNLSTGAVHSFAGSAIDASITAIGEGWYRCEVAANISSPVKVAIYTTDGTTSYDNGSIYIQSAQLESGMVATDVLTSGATTAKAGVLVDLPRINYDANGENGSLLLEPSRTNIERLSEYIGGWSLNSNITKTSNYIVSPDGTQNATRLQFSANGYVANTPQSLATYTISCYAKRNDNGTQNVGFFTNGSGVVNSAWAVTSEWKRFSYTFPALNGSFMGIAGVSGADISVYGFQIEGLATYPSSYIPNHSGTGGITRAADVCSGAGDASTFNDSEGVLYAEFNTLSINPASSRYITISNGSASNRIAIRQPSGADNQVSLFVVVGGSVQVNLTHTLNILNFNKIAIKYKVNDFALWVNGVEVLTDTSGSVPAEGTLNKLDFANFNGSSLPFEGNAKQILYFPTALTDSELATLTTL